MTPAPAASSRFIKPVCLALCAIIIGFAARGLSSSYSYWLDEIFSVTASLDTWQQLYQRYILQIDPHPPLYHIFLKVWMFLFGASETATRLLSFSFALLTLSAFSLDAIAGRRWRRVIALIFIGVSPSFAYYAQETRSYSLVLTLASVVTLSILELRARTKDAGASATAVLNKVFYAGALLLSLTHYFGWIYVFVISLINFYEQRIVQARARVIILLAAMSLWPIWHVAVGAIANKTGGEFWIKVSPPVLGTITVFLGGSLPFLVDETSPFQHMAALLLLVSLAFVCVFRWQAIRSFLLADWRARSAIVDETRYVLLLVMMVVGALSLTDLHTPMSTSRNYIVLLPAVMIAVANSLTMLANLGGTKKQSGVISLLLIFLVSVLLAQLSWSKLSAKIKPHQNWKDLAAYVRQSKVCADGCFVIGSYGLYPFYFAGAGVIDDLSVPKAAMGTKARSATLDEQVDYVKNRPGAKIIGFHVASGKVAELMEVNRHRECIQPQQSWPNSTFLILPKQSLTGEEAKNGMDKCA